MDFSFFEIPKPSKHIWDSRESIACFLKRNPNTSFAAYEDGQLVDAILAGHDGRRGYIYHTVVLPKYRGRGIASSLVEMAVEALRKEDRLPLSTQGIKQS